MPKLKFVETKIAAIEGFGVRFLHSGPGKVRGRDVRSDLEEVPGYGYRRAAAGNVTVRSWIATRFSPNYPGYAVDVLDGQGRPVHGATLLSTVRDGYR